MGKLDGQIAVITGGSSGIGLATAQLFAQEGAQVVITGRRQDGLDKAVAQIGDASAVTALRGDIAVLEDLDRIYEQITERHGHIDVLVANAGIVEPLTLEQATPEHFDRIFNTNARGTFFTVQKALPLLGTGSRVVLVSSASHVMGLPVHTTYAATKAAVRSFGRTWANDLKQRGIRVNVLSPGVTETPMLDIGDASATDEMRAQFEAMIPLDRLGNAREIAAGILFLSTDDSSYMIGNDLVVSGGLTQV